MTCLPSYAVSNETVRLPFAIPRTTLPSKQRIQVYAAQRPRNLYIEVGWSKLNALSSVKSIELPILSSVGMTPGP